MGKRERRRRRERAKRQPHVPSPVIVEFPPTAPRIRVIIEAGQPQELQEVARLYWEVTEQGKWARTVASIGDQKWVIATVPSISHAVLLHSLCTRCEEPIRVSNRSWAVRVGGTYLDQHNDKYICPECSDAQRQERENEAKLREEAARAETAREEERAQAVADKINEALAAEDAKEGSHSTLPRSSTALLLYLAIADHVIYRSNEPLPSAADLGSLGWTGDSERDREALLELYGAGLLAISSTTSHAVFTVSSEDDSVRFSSADVKWRLPGGSRAAKAMAQRITSHVTTAAGQEAHAARQCLAELVQHMEIVNVISYLDGLLVKKYDYPAVPEGRRQQLVEIVRKGLAAGYTSGQMICFAWRSADSAAGWKERNAHMGPPEASSGAVTILNNKIDKALELHHSIPEWDPPRWHREPLALTVLRRLNAEVERIRDRSVIDTCPQCDHHGMRETDTGQLTRCAHAQDQAHAESEGAEPSAP